MQREGVCFHHRLYNSQRRDSMLEDFEPFRLQLFRCCRRHEGQMYGSQYGVGRCRQF